MGTLQGRIAVVTGSGRGIGREIALKLASEGARVIVNDLDHEPAEEVADLIRAGGGQAVTVVGSVTDEGFAERFVGTAVDTFGGLDIIVNNAGFTWDSVVQKMTDEQWSVILDVHLGAPFRILRAAQPVFSRLAKQEREQGVPRCRKVVNVSSISGTAGNAGQANYSAAKAGIIGLTRTMAKEWGRYNVTVNAVAFALIRTRMTEVVAGTESYLEVGDRKVKAGINAQFLAQMEEQIPLGRAGTPQDAAGAVYLLTLPESDYISGQVLGCSGGLPI